MRIIAFITHSADIRPILEYIEVQSEPQHLSPSRRLPMWEDRDAQVGEGVQVDPVKLTPFHGKILGGGMAVEVAHGSFTELPSARKLIPIRH